VFKIITAIILQITNPNVAPNPAMDEPCANTFCCGLCDDRDKGCNSCGRNLGACDGTVLTCEAGCYNGGYACGNTSQPWTGGCCS
jgi:hypothetical protein